MTACGGVLAGRKSRASGGGELERAHHGTRGEAASQGEASGCPRPRPVPAWRGERRKTAVAERRGKTRVSAERWLTGELRREGGRPVLQTGSWGGGASV